MANLSILVGCLAIVFFTVVAPVSSATHSVEWSLGKDYSFFATGKPYAVGDTIVFNYGAGHTVDEVSESDYKGCTLGNSISSDSSGTTSIVLKKVGSHYFICAIPGHCASGMKLSVNVGAAASSDGRKAAPTASATAVLKPFKALVVTCVVLLLYAMALS